MNEEPCVGSFTTLTSFQRDAVAYGCNGEHTLVIIFILISQVLTGRKGIGQMLNVLIQANCSLHFNQVSLVARLYCVKAIIEPFSLAHEEVRCTLLS